MRLTKHVLDKSYSDSLGFDLQRQHAAELSRKASSQPLSTMSGAGRAQGVLKGRHRLPTKAHLSPSARCQSS